MADLKSTISVELSPEGIQQMIEEHSELVNSYQELQDRYDADIKRLKDKHHYEMQCMVEECDKRVAAEREKAEHEYHERTTKIVNQWNEELKKEAAAKEQAMNENKTFIKVMDNQSNIIDLLLESQRAAIAREEKRINRARSVNDLVHKFNDRKSFDCSKCKKLRNCLDDSSTWTNCLNYIYDDSTEKLMKTLDTNSEISGN